MEHDINVPVVVVADGLSESECQSLSGMNGVDALKWCANRHADHIERMRADVQSLRDAHRSRVAHVERLAAIILERDATIAVLRKTPS